jgi:hypothetical protein
MKSTNEWGKAANMPKNPFMYYSSFKLAVYFHNKVDKCMPIHSVETKATIPQLRYRKIEFVLLDRMYGYQWCIDKCNSLSGKIHHALLYSAYDTNILYGKFFNERWHIIQEPVFDESNRFIKSSQYKLSDSGFVIFGDIPANELHIKQ